MSGICGVWALDGGVPDLSQVLANLERRGPDGTQQSRDGHVALGHTLLATTPEALVEVLPLTDTASGCTITADVRLDNREELIGELQIDGETRVIGDGELILRAFERWGKECPVHLLGDFAFAIWDPAAQRLFCARDHMGMRQFLYHYSPGRLFAFATEADALVAHPDVPKRINKGRIADFLDNLEGLDFTSTFFEDVVRLPPAHTLTLDSEGLTLHRYWKLEPGNELRLNTDQDYAAAFLEVFTKAVRCRLRSAGSVGSMLSGGLDSNSIAAVAAAEMAEAGRSPLPTFSAIGSDLSACDESKSIRAAIRCPLYLPTVIRRHELAGGSGEVLRMTQQCAEPFDGYSVISKVVYEAARRMGINVMFDGAGADVILTPGNHVAELLHGGKILSAAREARLESQFWGPTWPAPRIFFSAVWAAFAPHWLRRLRWRLRRWLADYVMLQGRSSISREFAQKVDLGQRRRCFERHLSRGRPIGTAYRARSICHPHLVVARERYDRVAAAFGIEPRDPFMDIRLIQFSLSLPPEQLQADGWPKAILRRAMAGKVPAEIAWRRGKPHLGWSFTNELIRLWSALPTEQANVRRVMAMMGSVSRNRISSGIDKAAWLKLMILNTWLERNQSARNQV